MNFIKKLFGITPGNKSASDVTQIPVDGKNEMIPNFAKQNDTERQKMILALDGDTRLDVFELYQYAIEFDTNIHVRLSALKRIHVFKYLDDLKSLLIRIDNSKNARQLEPYLSIALSRSGIITIDEYKKRIESF
jgi:hypothetical protein